ncbi:hypothetical protein Scep_017202 [Stephania cephalantha]|uniref:Uncharacterized protein n=1 Tax=Stephania cephalantha TaxID=152367 RepID=A0AAP0NUT5_9MAGN
MTDQREASSARGRRGLTGGRLPAAPAVGDSRQWEETTNTKNKRSKAAAGRERYAQAKCASGAAAARAAAAKCNQPLRRGVLASNFQRPGGYGSRRTTDGRASLRRTGRWIAGERK